MCFAVPLQIKEKKGDKFVMESGRVVKRLVKGVKRGDYLICQHDMGVDKLSKAEAQKMRKAIKGVSDDMQARD